ncbi:MAG TPA: ComF family protein [Treponema sp.]|nr:ComF family protein [Treponema sp.]
MGTLFSYSISFFREWCFGIGCGLCGRPLMGAVEYRYGLCQDCQEELSLDLYDDSRCARCGRPLISERNCCMTCRQRDPPPQDIALTLYPYQGTAKKLLETYKFHRNLHLGWFLAKGLLEGARYLAERGFLFDAWVPVPPRPGKIKEKGWDQIATLSRYITKLSSSSQVSMPVVSCLERLASSSQKKLHRTERAINLKGKIQAVQRVPKRCLLFDDVTTTGSTLRICAETLKENGAETVGTIALFYD